MSLESRNTDFFTVLVRRRMPLKQIKTPRLTYFCQLQAKVKVIRFDMSRKNEFSKNTKVQ